MHPTTTVARKIVKSTLHLYRESFLSHAMPMMTGSPDDQITHLTRCSSLSEFYWNLRHQYQIDHNGISPFLFLETASPKTFWRIVYNMCHLQRERDTLSAENKWLSGIWVNKYCNKSSTFSKIHFFWYLSSDFIK